MIHIFLATGFEEIEALTVLDVLRRFGLDVCTVSVTGTRLIHGAHGIPVMADTLYRRAEVEGSQCLVLPGGMPGAKNLMACDALCRSLLSQNKNGGLIAAICAAPMILGKLNILAGRKATCYPGFEHLLNGAECRGTLVEEDGNIITGKGPGAAMEFAFLIASHFVDEGKRNRMRYDMIL